MNLHPDICAYLRKKAERDYQATLPHYVYCAADKNNRVKIGVTGDIEKRKKQLQHANPDIEIKSFILTPNRSKAFELEGILHEKAYKMHITGEWYQSDAWDIFESARKGANEMQELKWLPPTVLPEKDDHIIVRFCNDLDTFEAAGLFYLTVDTNEPVFCDVLAGHIYDWQSLVIEWAKLS